jgi:hypothetical protein
VNDSGNTGRVPRYVCTGSRRERGSASCLSAGALRLDEAVAAEVLAAIQPVGIEAAFQAEEQLTQHNDQKRISLTLALERAQFEARRAQRQYDAVDPDHRLVAAELERRWNLALEVVAKLQSRIAALDDEVKELSDETRASLHELGADLSTAWHHPDTDIRLRKRILRTVLKAIVLNNVDDPPSHHLHLHWQGGVHTPLHVPRNSRGKTANTVSADVLEWVRELSKVAEDKQIAAVLNRLGYPRPAKGNHGMHIGWRAWPSETASACRHYSGVAKGVTACKHPSTRAIHAPVIAQGAQQGLGENHRAVLRPLALLDAQQPALTVDVAHFQRHHLAHAQTAPSQHVINNVRCLRLVQAPIIEATSRRVNSSGMRCAFLGIDIATSNAAHPSTWNRKTALIRQSSPNKSGDSGSLPRWIERRQLSTVSSIEPIKIVGVAQFGIEVADLKKDGQIGILCHRNSTR